MADLAQLASYILGLCNAQNLSMRQASIRASLAPETISTIVRRGSRITPRPETLKLIADTLNGDFGHMMRLAGHLPTLPEGSIGHVPQLLAFAERLSRLPLKRQRLIMRAALVLLEAGEAAENVTEGRILPEPTICNSGNAGNLD